MDEHTTARVTERSDSAVIHRLPNKVDKVNSAVDRAFRALSEVRIAEWDAGMNRRVESARADKAHAEATAAIADLQKLALGLEDAS